jgi:hypothetical protein
MVRQLHIDAPVYHVMCLLGKKYPANETDFRRSGLPGVFEPAKAGSRLKVTTRALTHCLLLCPLAVMTIGVVVIVLTLAVLVCDH